MKSGDILKWITAARCLDCVIPIGWIKSLIGPNDKISKKFLVKHYKKYHMVVYEWIMYVCLYYILF